MKSRVADVLVDLQQANGLIAADFVDLGGFTWDGQQRHFAYTTITAANGLCSASRLRSGRR